MYCTSNTTNIATTNDHVHIVGDDFDPYCLKNSIYSHCLDQLQQSFKQYWKPCDAQFICKIFNIVKNLIHIACEVNRAELSANVIGLFQCYSGIQSQIMECLLPYADHYSDFNRENALEFLVKLSDNKCVEFNDDANAIGECVVPKIAECNVEQSKFVEMVYWTVLREFSCEIKTNS